MAEVKVKEMRPPRLVTANVEKVDYDSLDMNLFIELLPYLRKLNVRRSVFWMLALVLMVLINLCGFAFIFTLFGVPSWVYILLRVLGITTVVGGILGAFSPQVSDKLFGIHSDRVPLRLVNGYASMINDKIVFHFGKQYQIDATGKVTWYGAVPNIVSSKVDIGAYLAPALLSDIIKHGTIYFSGQIKNNRVFEMFYYVTDSFKILDEFDACILEDLSALVVANQSTTPEVVEPIVANQSTTPEVVEPIVADKSTTPEVVEPIVANQSTTEIK